MITEILYMEQEELKKEESKINTIWERMRETKQTAIDDTKR